MLQCNAMVALVAMATMVAMVARLTAVMLLHWNGDGWVLNAVGGKRSRPSEPINFYELLQSFVPIFDANILQNMDCKLFVFCENVHVFTFLTRFTIYSHFFGGAVENIYFWGIFLPTWCRMWENFQSIKRPPGKRLHIFFRPRNLILSSRFWGHLFPDPANWKYKTNFSFARK